jgi:hypothetical protein
MVPQDMELPLQLTTLLLLNRMLVLPSSTSVTTTTVEDHPAELAERILTTSPERKSAALPLPGASAFFSLLEHGVSAYIPSSMMDARTPNSSALGAKLSSPPSLPTAADKAIVIPLSF